MRADCLLASTRTKGQRYERTFAGPDRCAPFASELASREQQRNVRQSLGMTSAGSSLSFSAFATANSGSEYLATAEHYRYLAKGIVDALHRGCLVLVTGDPPANPPMLAAALREASAPRPVIELPCGPDLDCAQLFGGGSECPGTSAPVATGEDAGSSALSSPIYLFADADRLSDDQIDEFYEAGQAMLPGPHGFEAGVLLAHSDFVTRAESVESHLLDEGLAGHLRVQQLERDEVEAFIRRQLPPGEGANLFTAQRVALIAITSGGDPVVVNRLARRMLQTEPDVSTPPRVTRRRYAVSLRLPAGIIICLGAAWLVAGGAFERQDLGACVGLVRDHILPRNEPAEAPAGVGAAPGASRRAMGSPSADARRSCLHLRLLLSAVETPEPAPRSASGRPAALRCRDCGSCGAWRCVPSCGRHRFGPALLRACRGFGRRSRGDAHGSDLRCDVSRPRWLARSGQRPGASRILVPACPRAR